MATGPPGPSAQPVGCDGRIVEVAVAAEEVPSRVVPRRSAEPVGDARAGDHASGAGQGDVHGGSRRLPRALDDRRGRVKGPISDTAAWRIRLRPRVPGRAQRRMPQRIGHDAVTAGPADPPLVPGRLEVADQPRIVHRQDRLEAEIVGCYVLEGAVSVDGGQDRCRSGADLERGDLAPAGQLPWRLVEGVQRAGDDDHRRSSRAVDSRP